MFYMPNDLFRWIKELKMIFPMVEASFDPYDVSQYYNFESICLDNIREHRICSKTDG
jgi:hypothetical protein